MAQKLSVQIALEGGKEVERQLAGIGEAGQKAFEQIRQSAEVAGGFKNLKISEVTAQLKEMGVTGKQSIDQINQAVRTAGRFENVTAGVVDLERTFDRAAAGAQRATAAFGLTRKEIAALKTGLRQIDLGAFGSQLAVLGRVGAAFGPVGIGITAVGTALAATTALTIGFANAISKTSAEAAKLGLSFQQLKNLQAEFAKAGISGDVAADGIAHFQKELQKTIEGADPGSQLRLFGDAAKMLQPELEKLLVRLRGMPDGFERTNLAVSQLGEKFGTAFIQSLRRAEGSMTADEAKAYDLAKALTQLSTAIGKVGTVAFAPALAAGISNVATAIDAVNAKAARDPFGTWVQGASLLNPVNLTIQGIVASLGLIPPAADQAAVGMGKIVQGASLLNPVNAVVQGILFSLGQIPPAANQAGQSLQQTGQAGAQAGQTAAQGGQTAAQGWTVWDSTLQRAVSTAGQVGSAGQQAGQSAAQGGQTANQGWIVWDSTLQRAVSTMGQVGPAAQQAGQAASQAGTTAGSGWISFISIIESAINKVKELLRMKPPSLGGAGGTQIGGAARGGLIFGHGSGTSDSNLAWVSRGEHIMPAHVVRQPGVLAFLEALRRGGGIPGFAEGGQVGGPGIIGQLGQALRGVFQQLQQAVDGMNAAMDPLHDNLVRVMDGLNRSIVTAIQAVNQGIGQIESQLGTSMNAVAQLIIGAMNTLSQLIQAVEQEAQGKAGGIGHAARGGLLGGRGTGTSDSNLAWLSRGEYVTPARAVRQPGVLAFLEALRRSGGNLRAVLDGMGRFALGGLVPRPMPAFAGGGAVGSMSHVTINFPGLAPISGLRASAAVVDELRNAAAMAQVRSGGRKPSRYS